MAAAPGKSRGPSGACSRARQPSAIDRRLGTGRDALAPDRECSIYILSWVTIGTR